MSKADLPVHNGVRAFTAGLGLAFLRKPRAAQLQIGAGLYCLAIAFHIALSLLLDCVAVETPRSFDSWGFDSQALHAMGALFVAYLLADALRRPALLWPLAMLSTAAGLVTGSVMQLIDVQVDAAFDADDPLHEKLNEALFGLKLLWWLAIEARLLAALAPERSGLWRLRIAACAVGLIGLLGWYLPATPYWDEAQDEQASETPQDPLIAEDVFGNQPALLQNALDGVAASIAGPPQLYFLAFAPDGSQHVFVHEARYAQQLFDRRFGTAGHSLVLANSRDSIDELPLATTSNLEDALQGLSERMRADDILFMYLTSHGGEDASLPVRLEDLTFEPFSAPVLADLLRNSGIRWKVIVVSACYSGSFIPALQDAHTLVITAARADRSSFGCADTADFTYFGRALLAGALQQTHSFPQAYELARAQITQWERAERDTPSEPQIDRGALIEPQLLRWQQALEHTAAH